MRRILLVTALSLLAASPAAAEVRIHSSPGGQIGKFAMLFAMVRESGERVVIDGPCLSACTLVLSLVPRSRICVTRRAVLGFHAAWRPGHDGRPLTSASATRLMMDTYPQGVRNWIERNGGLTSRTLLLRGRALSALYRMCS